MSDATEPTETFGLFQLYPLAESVDDTKVDIVAIHGLGGHPFKTWTEGSRLWLRDFLPISLPEARTLTFGYDAGIAFDKSASEIPDFARDLLERLRTRRRKQPKNRPIIFVCHSLGGIVFKKALVVAHERQSRYGELLKAVRGVVFLGTPHRGADVAYWSRILGKLANIPLIGSIRTNLLKDLEPKSKILGEICSQFVERGQNLQIFTFYERVKTDGLNALVVDQDSAVLHLPNEVPLPMEADHRNMCKFASSSSQRFESLVNSLQELVDDADDDEQAGHNYTVEQSRFIQSLRDSETFLDPIRMWDKVPSSTTGTCQWIHHESKVTDWALGRAKCLWISGSAGSGKSVLTKHIINALRQGLLPPRSQGAALSRLCVAFAFCDSKIPDSDGAASILRSLLYQVLKSEPHLSRYVDESYLEHMPKDPSPELFMEIFSSLVTQARRLRFVLAIDGMDELSAKSAHVLQKLLLQLAANDLVGRLQLLFSDRGGAPSSFSQRNRSTLSLRLDGDRTRHDVWLYVRDLVSHFTLENNMPQSMHNEIEKAIFEQSRGLFLLASLNWSTFTQGANYWSRQIVREKLTELRSAPQNIEALYCNLLAQIPEDIRLFFKKVFMMLLVAKGPLSWMEIHICAIINESQSSFENIEDNLLFNFQNIFRQYGGPFFHLHNDTEIQFRHFSVREFLQRRSEIAEHELILKQYRASVESCEYLASKICLQILLFQDWFEFLKSVAPLTYPTEGTKINAGGRQAIHEKYPLLMYAAQHWSKHFEKVQWEPEMIDRAASLLLTEKYRYLLMLITGLDPEPIKVTKQSQLGNVDDPRASLRHSPRRYNSSLHTLTEIGDFVPLARHLLNLQQDLNHLDQEGLTPLHLAVKEGRIGITTLLLSDHRIDPNFASSGNDKPIHTSIDPRWAKTAIFEVFLDMNRVDINSTGQMGYTALHKLMSLGQEFYSWLELLLLKSGLLLNERDTSGNTPLIVGLLRGRSEAAVLKLLRTSENVDISARDENRTNALSLACIRGWSEVRKVLMARDRSQAVTTSSDGMNILTRPAFFGQRTTLLNILRDLRVDEVREIHNQGRFNLTNLCAQQDWADIVDLLHTDFGLESQDQDTIGRTVLHWAAESGWQYGQSMFSSKQTALINVQDFDGCTPLHLAAQNRNFEATKFLVAAGANQLLRDKYGRTPVHTAAEFGSRAILEFLLQDNVREYGRDNLGRSVLHYIATWEWEISLVKFLKIKRPLVNVLDKHRRSPLHLAAIYGNVRVVGILLAHGAQIDKRDVLGFTAAFHAVQQGHPDVLRVLLEHNTDIRRKDGFGRTCVQIALPSNSTEVAVLLEAEGLQVPLWQPDNTVQGETGPQDSRRSSIQSFRPILDVAEPDPDAEQTDVTSWGGNNLHRIGLDDSPEQIQQCITDNPDGLNEIDKRGWTPLHIATINGNPEAFRKLLEAGSSPAAANPYGGWTILHITAWTNDVMTAKIVLDFEKSLPIDIKCSDGSTPAYLAGLAGNFAFLRFCIDRGADISISVPGRLPFLFRAMLVGNQPFVDRVGRHLNTRDVKIALRHDDSTPLHLAVAWDRWSSVPTLVDLCSAEIAASPALRVSLFGLFNGLLDTERWGFRFGPQRPDYCLKKWSDALYRGYDSMPTRFVLKMFEKRESTDSDDFDSFEERFEAKVSEMLRFSHEDLIAFIWSESRHGPPGAPCWLVKSRGQHPVFKTLATDHLQCFEACNGINPLTMRGTLDKQSALHVLAQWHCMEISWSEEGTPGVRSFGELCELPIGWWVDHNMDMNETNDDGETALMLIARRNSILDPHMQDGIAGLLIWMLDAGADPLIKRKDGLTALDIAEQSGSYLFARIMKRAIGHQAT